MKFVYGLVLGILLMFILNQVKKICLLGYSDDSILKEIIKILTRQSARWATAAKQDENSLIAVLHANYGAGYLWALKDIATPDQIKYATGIDINEFQKEIVSTQDKVTRRMAKLCPDYAPEPSYLTKIGGEG